MTVTEKLVGAFHYAKEVGYSAKEAAGRAFTKEKMYAVKDKVTGYVAGAFETVTSLVTANWDPTQTLPARTQDSEESDTEEADKDWEIIEAAFRSSPNPPSSAKNQGGPLYARRRAINSPLPEEEE